jgi:mannose-1-phosphate guanylyltransferase
MEYAVIMAGGIGTRFWPKSTKKRPKQCLGLIYDKPLIDVTVDRLKGLFGDNIYVATGSKLKEKISNILPETKFILEPMARNTTGCIGLACVQLLKKDKDATIFIETADHVYKDNDKYYEYIREALSLAEEGKIVTIGINPFEPSPSFGYIKTGVAHKENSFLVDSFVEKPTFDVANRYLQEGGYLWNSGMYIFRADRMLEEIQRYEPEIYTCLMKIFDALGTSEEERVTMEEFSKMKSIQIDYAVSERSDNLVVLKADMYWDDIGSWLSLERYKDKDDRGNVVEGKYIGVDGNNNIISSNKLVATVGLKDHIVISTDDVVLICPKNRIEEVRGIIGKIKDNSWTEYL